MDSRAISHIKPSKKILLVNVDVSTVLRSSSGAGSGDIVNEVCLAGGTLYRCGTIIGMKKFVLVEMWKKIFTECKRDGRHRK